MHDIFDGLTFWILHPDGPGKPEWRRCGFSLSSNRGGAVYLSVTIRRKKGSAEMPELFRSYGFLACIDRIFEDILTEGEAGYDGRTYPLLDKYNRGFVNQPGKSPVLTFTLNDWAADRVRRATAHGAIRMKRAARKTAARENLRRQI